MKDLFSQCGSAQGSRRTPIRRDGLSYSFPKYRHQRKEGFDNCMYNLAGVSKKIRLKASLDIPIERISYLHPLLFQIHSNTSLTNTSLTPSKMHRILLDLSKAKFEKRSSERCHYNTPWSSASNSMSCQAPTSNPLLLL
jgi:hypothetical protein